MNRVRLSSRFRLVLPRPVRQRLRLCPGMKFTVLGKGGVIILVPEVDAGFPWHRAVKRNDPAAHDWLEVLLCDTPLHAVMLHRLVHWLYTRAGLRLVGRLIATLSRFWTGVEIHPAARIGRSFFLDHGAGVVIGETAVVGDSCIMFHNVTLGGTGKYEGQRHPRVGHHVFLGTGAILLGPIRVGDHARVGANALVINRDVPPRATVVGTPARIVKLDGQRVEAELPRMTPPPGAVPVELEV